MEIIYGRSLVDSWQWPGGLTASATQLAQHDRWKTLPNNICKVLSENQENSRSYLRLIHFFLFLSWIDEGKSKAGNVFLQTLLTDLSFLSLNFAPPLQITIYFFLHLQLSGVTTEWHIGRLEDRKRSRPKVYSFSNHSRWRNLSKGSPQLRGALKIWKEVFSSNSENKSCLQKADMNHAPQTRVELKIETFHPGSSRRGAEAQNTSTHLSKV